LFNTKKTTMKIFNTLLALFLLLFFTSCEKDETKNLGSDGLLGQWEVSALDYTGSTITEIPDVEIPVLDFEGNGRDLDLSIEFLESTFTSEGSYTIDLTMEFGGQSSTVPYPVQGFIGVGDWSMEGNTLTISTPGAEPYPAEINQVDDNTMTLNYILTIDNSQPGAIVTSNVDLTYTLTRM